MKTTVIATSVMKNAKLLQLETVGVSNVVEMHVLTQRDDLERFSTEDYFGDDDIITGSSYISATYFYADADTIAKQQELLMNQISSLQDLAEEDDELMEVYFIIFDADNGKQLLVSNAIETLMTFDIDIDEVPKIKSITCGSTADDADISSLITEALWVHPLTKGIKVPGSDFFENKEGEIPSFSEFEEYTGDFFSCTKSLKKDPEWFEFFEAAMKLVIRNKEFNHGYNMDDVIDDNEFILNQYKSCKDIPDMVQLVFNSEESHKFYNVEINNCAVIIEYGGVGKSSTVDEKDFSSYEEAKKFMDKKVISKIKSGYVKH